MSAPAAWVLSDAAYTGGAEQCLRDLLQAADVVMAECRTHRERLTRSFGDSPTRLVQVGALDVRKGGDVFLEAARLLVAALAHGLPIVATRVEGNLDLVVEGWKGRLVSPAPRDGLKPRRPGADPLVGSSSAHAA